ncbi:MAG: hypothetical protein M3Q31_24635 [Actinomycetota bacterium]|nr:hypothetical protein [Actinomycetota bacterium]
MLDPARAGLWRVALRTLSRALRGDVLVVLAPENGGLPLRRSARRLESLDA